MDEQTVEIQEIEQAFFSALTEGDTAALERLLSADFVMIDFLDGSEVSREVLIRSLTTNHIAYEDIEVFESRVRFFGKTAVVTGWMAIQGRVGRLKYGGDSRYTHVYAADDTGEWRLVSAQGTAINHDGI